jgi:hypothetical protein
MHTPDVNVDDHDGRDPAEWDRTIRDLALAVMTLREKVEQTRVENATLDSRVGQLEGWLSTFGTMCKAMSEASSLRTESR